MNYANGWIPAGTWQIEAVAVDAVTGPAAGGFVPKQPAVGDVVDAAVTVSAGTDGIGDIAGITFDDDALLTASPADNVDLSAMPVPPPPFSLSPGTQVTLHVPVEIAATGVVTLSSAVTGTDANGDPATATDGTTIRTARLNSMSRSIRNPSTC